MPGTQLAPEVAGERPSSVPPPRRRSYHRPNRIPVRPEYSEIMISKEATPFEISVQNTPTSHEDIAGHTPATVRQAEPRAAQRTLHTSKSGPRIEPIQAGARATRAGRKPVASTSHARIEPRMAGRRKPTARLFHWLVLRACGYAGAILFTILSLLFTAEILRLPTPWLGEAIAAIILIRYLNHVASKSTSVLAVHLVQDHASRSLASELRFSVAFLAACFVMKWPLAVNVVSVFLGVNVVTQLSLMTLSRPIVNSISRRRKKNQEASYTRTAFIVGTGPKGTKVADAILDSAELDTRVVGFLDYRRTGLWRYRDIPMVGHPDQLERSHYCRTNRCPVYRP